MSTTNPHHEGNQSLEFTPRKMEIKPNQLRIIWGKDKRYWNVPEDGGPAELYQVCWLEVTGCVSKTERHEEYEVGFNISFTPDAFGWSGSPVYILVKRGKEGTFKGQRFKIDTSKESDVIKVKTAKITGAEAKAADDSDIYFGLYEVWRGKWKGGLKIHSAFIQQPEV